MSGANENQEPEMSGETKGAISGWTVDTLKLYLEARIDEARALGLSDLNGHAMLDLQRHLESEKALEKVATATEKRFESVNEFRKTLADQSDRMMPRVESEQRHQANQEKLDTYAQQGQLARDALSARLDELNRRMLLREGAESGTREVSGNRRVWDTNILGWIVAAGLAIFVAFYTKGS